MGHRINVMIDDPVWQALQQVPQGERSRLISDAVHKELQRRKRSRASSAMDALRKSSRKATLSAEELVRADRGTHW